jgi:hypothetical protein
VGDLTIIGISTVVVLLCTPDEVVVEEVAVEELEELAFRWRRCLRLWN